MIIAARLPARLVPNLVPLRVVGLAARLRAEPTLSGDNALVGELEFSIAPVPLLILS